MILREATIKYSGVDPDLLKHNSNKRICCSCDQCGRVRWLNYHNYRDLCKSCSHSGKVTIKCDYCGKLKKVQPSYKHEHNFCSYKCKGSWQSENLIGKDSNNWKGGLSGNRSYVKRECNCIKLNSRFKGSEMHHIMSGVVIYILCDIHNRKYGILHSLKNNKNMDIINKITFNFLMGDY